MAKKRVSDRFCILRQNLRDAGLREKRFLTHLYGEKYLGPQGQRQHSRHKSLPVKLILQQRNVQIYQHYHENEKNHDTDDIQDHLHDEKELSLKEQKNTGRCEERGNQI